MYPVLVAHANDHANPEDALLTSGALLLVFGVGSIIGPAMAGVLMGAMGSKGLFATTLIAHILLAGYALWRMTRRQSVTQANKDPFHAQAPANNTTPQTTTYRVTTDESLAQEGIDLSDHSEPTLDLTHTHTTDVIQSQADNGLVGNDEHWSRVV